MKVKDLMKKLSDYNLEKEILFVIEDINAEYPDNKVEDCIIIEDESFVNLYIEG